jgi:hypothetical protein
MGRYLFLALLLVGCLEKGAQDALSTVPKICRGEFYERDQQGDLHRYNEYQVDGRCLLDNMSLTHLDQTMENWRKRNVTCVPQPTFASRTLVAANNYYDTRNGNVFLQFDSDTGIFKRIVLATNQWNSKPVYAKLQGCFYVRDNQILLDTDPNKLITSQWFDPMEIFSFVEVNNELNMTRFDDVGDYSYMNCPTERSEWKFCEKLRNGNVMYFPDTLTAQEKEDLKTEAILISVQFNYVNSDEVAFNTLWNTIGNTRKDAAREDYVYDMIPIPDVPRFIDGAWRDYVMGNRPTMPDVDSNTRPNLCYFGSKTITLDDGSSGRIRGEICYDNGVYSFVQILD